MRFMALLTCLVLLLWAKGLPAEAQLLQTVSDAPQYSTLVALLTAVNLTTTLSSALQSGTTVTIFAPNNTAFSGLNATCLTSTPARTEILKTILLYHVAPVRVPAPTNGQILSTLANQNLTITINGTSIFVNKDLVTAPGVVVDPQGVVHGLASVLIPPAGGAAEAVGACLLAAPGPRLAPGSPPLMGGSPPLMGGSAPAPAPSSGSVLLLKSSAVLSLAAVTAMAMLF